MRTIRDIILGIVDVLEMPIVLIRWILGDNKEDEGMWSHLEK